MLLFRKEGRIVHEGKRDCPSLPWSVIEDIQKKPFWTGSFLLENWAEKSDRVFLIEGKQSAKAWNKRAQRKVISSESLGEVGKIIDKEDTILKSILAESWCYYILLVYKALASSNTHDHCLIFGFDPKIIASKCSTWPEPHHFSVYIPSCLQEKLTFISLFKPLQWLSTTFRTQFRYFSRTDENFLHLLVISSYQHIKSKFLAIPKDLPFSNFLILSISYSHIFIQTCKFCSSLFLYIMVTWQPGQHIMVHNFAKYQLLFEQFPHLCFS